MPIMPQYRSPYGQSILELLAGQGDAAARAAERSGMIWANAVQNLGQIGAQAYEQHQQQKDQQQREALFDEAVATFDPANPQDFYRRAAVAVGPEKAIMAMRAFAAVEETKKKGAPDPKLFEPKAQFIKTMWESNPEWVKKNWGGIFQAAGQEANVLFGTNFTPEWSDDYGQAIGAFGAQQKPQAAPDRMEQNGIVYERQQDGKWVPALGIPEEKPEVKPDARSLDARYAEAVATGNQEEAQKLLTAKARLEAAGWAPAGAGSKIWVIRNGQTIRIGENEYQPGDQPTGQRERPVTGAERQGLSFYLRAKNASEDLARLEDGIVKAGPLEQAQLQWAPNMLQSDQQQLYRQGQRAFTEARLRKDSGATIKKDEYESDAKTYFAQPGDSLAVLEQKRRARAKVLDALKVTTGRAYAEHFGDEGTDAASSAADPLGLR